MNLEDPDVRRMAETDGADFMRRHPAPLILDEVQRVPELLSRIQVLVDANPKRRRHMSLRDRISLPSVQAFPRRSPDALQWRDFCR